MKGKFLFVLLFSAINLTACGNGTPVESDLESRAALSELEQTESERNCQVQTETKENSQTEVSPVTAVSADVTSGAAYIYQGDPVKISHEYSIDGGVQSFGLMVLCDGLAVPFSTSPDGEASVLQIIPNSPGETVSTDLYVTPIGAAGDQVSVQIVDIVEPDFDISSLDLESDDTGSPLQPLISGHRYDVDSLGGITITMEADGISNTATVSEQFETEEIPQEVIEANKQVNDDGTVTNQLSYFKAEAEAAKLYQLKKGEILPLDITFSGTDGQDIFVSFYLDNEIYPVFDGCEYLRCHVDDTSYTKVHGELDTGKLEAGRYICYTVCGNVEYNKHADPIPAFILEVS